MLSFWNMSLLISSVSAHKNIPRTPGIPANDIMHPKNVYALPAHSPLQNAPNNKMQSPTSEEAAESEPPRARLCLPRLSYTSPDFSIRRSINLSCILAPRRCVFPAPRPPPDPRCTVHDAEMDRLKNIWPRSRAVERRVGRIVPKSQDDVYLGQSLVGGVCKTELQQYACSKIVFLERCRLVDN